ncbi:MotA/TolQ/ExbB proton channel family protein [Candidatus Desantisbacteria bacterium]|nr:MotA/TolQ/ExbB proton channel family protein [Candidatus Desantisbacteria bacterium]
MFQSYNILQLLIQGGIAMIPLLFCSLLIVAVIIERFLAYRRIKFDVEDTLYKIQHSVLKGNILEAVSLCEAKTSPIAVIFKAGLLKHDRNRDEILEAMERARIEEGRRLKKYVWLLGTIGSCAPFIGLFGAIIGIMQAFHNIAATGSGGMAVVAGGIAEALVATAYGLVIAIVAVVGYNCCMVKIANTVEDMKIYTLRLLEILVDSREK